MKLHLRASGDMGKRHSTRTYCNMKANGKTFYRVTEYPAIITCKKCIKKLEQVSGRKVK